MAAEISLGLMEQPVMRQETLTEAEEQEVRGILSRVDHVEGKYLATLTQIEPILAQFEASGDLMAVMGAMGGGM